MKKEVVLIILVLFLGLVVVGSSNAAVDNNKIKSENTKTAFQESPWPQFKHDAQNTGQSPYKGPKTNHLKWKYKTGSDIFSSPAIDKDGNIYFGSNDGYLCVLKPDGKLKWEINICTGGSSSPAIDKDGNIYIGSNDGYLYALKPDSKLKWKYKTGSWVKSSPAIDKDGNIYFESNDGYLYALMSDGSLKWKFYIRFDGIDSPAISNDGTICFRKSVKYLVALNPDGEYKWEYEPYSGVCSSPAIDKDGNIYFGSGHYLYALKSDGRYKWKYKTGDFVFSSPTIDYNGNIYIGSNDGYLYALKPDSKLKWKYKTGSDIFSSPAIDKDGNIYFGSGHYLYALKSDGSLKWKYKTGDTIFSSPAIGYNGNIYFGSSDGYLYAIQDDDTPPIAKANPIGKIYNTNKSVILTMSESGNIYYTLNSTKPTTSSPRYTVPILISSSKILMYIAIDLAGNKSPIYTQKYTIDKIPPKIFSIIPINNKIDYSRTASIYLKFNEKIFTSTKWNYIKIKNLTTGKYLTLAKSLSNNVLLIKTSTRTAHIWYQIIIPIAAVRDTAGNKLAATYTFKFKTGA